MGSSSWSKGRLYLIRKRLDIRLPFPYARVLECCLTSRQRFSSRFHPPRLRLVPALLLVMVCAAPLQFEGQAGAGTQACGGNSTVDALGEKPAASARAFLAQLQAAVQSNNKEEIAGMISYPVLVLRSGKRTHVQKAQAFLLRRILKARDAYDILLLLNRGATLSGNLEKHLEDMLAGEFDSERIRERIEQVDSKLCRADLKNILPDAEYAPLEESGFEPLRDALRHVFAKSL